MKLIVFLLILLPFLFSYSEAFAFNEKAKGLLISIFEKARKPSHEELVEMLVPVAGDETLSHMQKIRDMSYLVHITGWHITKSKKNDLFHEAFRNLSVQRKVIYLEKHPDLDSQTREAIEASKVIIGMTKENVQASLGKPEEVKPAIGTFANTERWSYYTRRMVVYFKGDILASIKKM